MSKSSCVNEVLLPLDCMVRSSGVSSKLDKESTNVTSKLTFDVRPLMGVGGLREKRRLYVGIMAIVQEHGSRIIPVVFIAAKI